MTVHQAKAKLARRKVDKVRLPVIYDPENPTPADASIDNDAGDTMMQFDNGGADHSLFMADLSLI